MPKDQGVYSTKVEKCIELATQGFLFEEIKDKKIEGGSPNGRMVEEYFRQETDARKDLIENRISGGKTIIYTNWVEDGVKVLEKILIDKGFHQTVNYDIIDGSTPTKERGNIKERYNKKGYDKEYILIITKAAAEGVDLWNTKHMIVLDPAWNPSMMTQIIGRAVRKMSHRRILGKPDEEKNLVYVHKMVAITDKKYLKESEILEDVLSGDSALYSIIRKKDEKLVEINKKLKAMGKEFRTEVTEQSP